MCECVFVFVACRARCTVDDGKEEDEAPRIQNTRHRPHMELEHKLYAADNIHENAKDRQTDGVYRTRMHTSHARTHVRTHECVRARSFIV